MAQSIHVIIHSPSITARSHNIGYSVSSDSNALQNVNSTS